MLHLIFQSPLELAVLQRIGQGDEVVFFENALFRINTASMLKPAIDKMLSDDIQLYVLRDELQTRGIQIEELILGIEVIEYSDLVKLTEKNKVIRTWS